MRTLIVATAAISTLALAACGSETSGEFTTDEGETGEYVIDNDTGDTSASIMTDEGLVTMKSGSTAQVSELPGGFTVYPGATIVSNTVVERGDGAGAMIIFETSDSPEQIAAHYRAEAEAADVPVEADASINGGVFVTGQGANGIVFSISAGRDAEETGADDVTTGQLMVTRDLIG